MCKDFKCCDEEKCEEEAEKIGNAIQKTFQDHWGKPSACGVQPFIMRSGHQWPLVAPGRGDGEGAYFCNDWVRTFSNAVKSINSDCFGYSEKQFYYAGKGIKESQQMGWYFTGRYDGFGKPINKYGVVGELIHAFLEITCKDGSGSPVRLDDGFGEDGFIHDSNWPLSREGWSNDPNDIFPFNPRDTPIPVQ